MSIEVILKEHVENLGNRGEVVRVANGYARNFLLPRKLALAVTAENKRQIEREREKADAREALAAKLGAVELAIARRVGENETLYGSVTSGDIAEALAARDLAIDRRRIHLPEPLKTLGEHEVAIKLYRDVTAHVKVKIVPAA